MNRLGILQKDSDKLTWVDVLAERERRKMKARMRRKFAKEKDRRATHKHFSIWKKLDDQIIRDDEELEAL